MSKRILTISTFLLVTVAMFSYGFESIDLGDPWAEEFVEAPQDTLPPITPQYNTFIENGGSNPFDLKDPTIVNKEVEYDPESGMYFITEKIGENFYRPSTYMTLSEYLDWRSKEEENKYFKQLSGVKVDGGVSAFADPIENLNIKFNPLEQLFGGTEVSIQPQGNIDITLGFDHSFNDNPIYPLDRTRFTQFNFDMDIKMNLQGKIGEKLNLTTNYNSGATFNFDNQIKLDYNSDAFGEDDILKKIEAGDVSLPLKGTLIQGAPRLFGLKTELQFGHLRLTAIASQQQTENENLTLEGGAQVQEFEVPITEYDANRHFFLSHFNRDSYEEAMATLPYVKSLFHLKTLEVWITNDRDEVENVRDIVAFTDLGEPVRFTNPDQVHASPNQIMDLEGRPLAYNRANDLYDRILADADLKDISKTVSKLTNVYGLRQGIDFEKVSARKLTSTEYTYDAELGYISLNINLRPDQVLAVYYEYDYDVEPVSFNVGEQANETNKISSDEENPIQQVLFMKMLKSTTQPVDQPSWDLMMKNIYSIGAYQVDQEDFKLDVYYDDPGKGVKPFLPASNLAGQPLLQVLNLDRLNSQQDPQRDGRFDFIPGRTINLTSGRIIFPVLEPFGTSLEDKIDDPVYKEKYAYPDLYTQTQFQAIENAEKDRYVIKGSYKSSISSEISLGAFNIPPGSVNVSAGGRQLVEGVDYEVDYGSGRLRILNDAYIISGTPINVNFSQNNLFGLQQKTMVGLRADYDFGPNFNIGATALKLFERPFTYKVNIGEDPVNNSIYGLDFTYSKETPWLTKAVNALPLISTKAESNINLVAEAAYLKPGHARAINESKEDKSGVVYLDDFEGSSSPVNLRTSPATTWFLSSVPQDDDAGNNPKFPEQKRDSIYSGANRALLNWFTIYGSTNNNSLAVGDTSGSQHPYTAYVPEREVFPNKELDPTQLIQPNQTLDLAYYPNIRGPYNYDVPNGLPGVSAGVDLMDSTVYLRNPETRWGGITRALQTSDFQSSNIEFLEFWMLSPFLDDDDARSAASNADERQGTMYIDFGNISEDILKDSRHFSENSLPTSSTDSTRRTVTTTWGIIPLNQAVTNNFDNTSGAREYQDTGLDGINDTDEAIRFQNYLDELAALNNTVAQRVAQDPANDNFSHFLGVNPPAGADARYRYLSYNNPQGNSQASTGNTRASSTNRPDDEDINKDNTLNESESYYEYEIPIRMGVDARELDEGAAKYITDKREADNGRIWYRFRIPLRTEDKTTVGGISDFRSIRFMRIYLKDFKAPVTVRFATLDLIRSSWRRYGKELDGDEPMNCDATNQAFEIDGVNIEENSSREPFNYTLPTGLTREVSVGGVYQTVQNEQSLSLTVNNLCNGASKAVFKVMEKDLRVYEKLKMFVHAENIEGFDEVPTGELTAFIRMGSDMQENYYEYEIPLRMSDPSVTAGLSSTSSAYKDEVWLSENEFNFELSTLKELKEERNAMNASVTEEYSKQVGSHTIRVKGNPNFGLMKIAMLGIRNPGDDGGREYSAEVWFNEMRLTGLNERGGIAGLARMDVQLADLANVTMSGNYSSFGFGALDQGVDLRSKERTLGYDLSMAMNVDKFLPQEWGLKLPFYGQISQTKITPQFDAFDLDVALKDKINSADTQIQKDSIRSQSEEIVTRKAFNFTNVQKVNTNKKKNKKPMPWSPENFSLNYSYSNTLTQTPELEFEDATQQKGSLAYGFSRKAKYIEPFKKTFKNDKYLQLISKININPLPNSFTFTNFLDRRFISTRYRFTQLDEINGTYYTKYFTWDRDYALNWDITRSLKFNFGATANSVIDEPDEYDLKTNYAESEWKRVRRDSIWNSITQLGRAKNYGHNLNVTYKVPIHYIPVLDWISVRAQYKATYAWSAPGLQFADRGNVIQNSQDRQINGDFNFEKLYDKSKYLKQINRPSRSKRRGRATEKDGKDGKKTSSKSSKDKGDSKGGKKKKLKAPSTMEKAIIRPFLLVRRAKINYSERFATVVPGFTPEASLLGMESGFGAPGWGFVAGMQPTISNRIGGEDWLYNNRSWISNSLYLNEYVTQNYIQSFDGKLTLEPINDFTIDIEAKKTYSNNYSERFKNTELGGDNYEHGPFTEGGAMEITYSAMNTFFRDSNEELEQLFNEFEANQIVMSQRLGAGNGPHQDPDLAAKGYLDGYGRNQQDILIPAFIAAYTGQDAATMDLNLFNLLPKLNWRVRYDGLSKVPAFKSFLSKFSLEHAYRSNLGIANYKTNTDYYNTSPINTTERPYFNAQTHNFYTALEIPQIGITESFEPLIGVQAEFQNGMNFEVSYKKARTLDISTINTQMNEYSSKEGSITFGYLMRDVDIPFLSSTKKKKGKTKKEEEADKSKTNTPGRGGRSGVKKLEGKDLDIQFNVALRDDITTARDLDLGTSVTVSGSYDLSLSPSIEYKLNKQLSLRLFFDYRKTIPYTSQSFNRVTSSGGVVVRFEL